MGQVILHPMLLLSNATIESLTAFADIIEIAVSKAKVFTTNDRSTYSNIAFSLLGQVLERATGKSYSEVLASSIFQPLGMNHASTTKPKDSLGIIPYEANVWALDQGANNPYVSFLPHILSFN
jgi:CubicO group peptidase (beta-lactamase class C family)